MIRSFAVGWFVPPGSTGLRSESGLLAEELPSILKSPASNFRDHLPPYIYKDLHHFLSQIQAHNALELVQTDL